MTYLNIIELFEVNNDWIFTPTIANFQILKH